MKTLHIIRNMNDQLARMVLETSNGEESAVLLMQDAVYGELKIDPVTIYACQEDLLARQIEKGYPQVSYDEIAKLVTEYDRTIVW